MKVTYRIPVDPYAFIEVEDEEKELDGHKLKEAYDMLTAPFKSQEGLPHREWCKVLDSYLTTGEVENGAEVWARMSKYQQDVVQECKRSMKRINKESN